MTPTRALALAYLLSAACNNQNSIVFALSPPAGSDVDSYEIIIQKRDATRNLVYASGVQSLAAADGRDLTLEPLRVGFKLNDTGTYYARVVMDKKSDRATFAQNMSSYYFWAGEISVAGTLEQNAQTLLVTAAHDVDRDHFPSAAAWPLTIDSSNNERSRYQANVSLLDCADETAPPGLTHSAEHIHPFITPVCNHLGFDVSCSGSGTTCEDMGVDDLGATDMGVSDMAGSDMAGSDMAGSDMAGADMMTGPVLTNLTVLWSYNRPAPLSPDTRWATTTGVTATVDSFDKISALNGGTLTNFMPGTCLGYEPIAFDAGRILQWSTGGGANCTAMGTLSGEVNPTIGNFNAVVGAPLTTLAASGRTDGFVLGGTFLMPSATSAMFDDSLFFSADVRSADASVAWAGAATRIGLQLVIESHETIANTLVTYTMETSGGYGASDLSTSQLGAPTNGIFENGASARVPVTASVPGVVCGGLTACFADVRLMFLDASTMALVYQMGGTNPVLSSSALNSLRGAVILAAP